ncbi:hypothetical protein BSR09_00735 [Stutzerimonas degradans]|nr:hypothetical protein BSR09_00735 [Stutzerimonas degradans]
MSDLHGDIMNIPCDPTRSPVGGVNAELAYKYGHRDARHAAAELASAHHAERAKPAEAEGPSFAEVLEQTSWLQQLGAKNKRIDELIAALSAVTAERDRLRDALRPFSAFEAVRSQQGGCTPKHGTVWAVASQVEEAEITVEHLQEAVAAMASKEA